MYIAWCSLVWARGNMSSKSVGGGSSLRGCMQSLLAGVLVNMSVKSAGKDWSSAGCMQSLLPSVRFWLGGSACVVLVLCRFLRSWCK